MANDVRGSPVSGTDPPTSTFIVDLRHIDACNAGMVDALARLKLTLLRSGCRLEVKNAPVEFADLISFMGLAGVLLVVEP
jgi:STAS domain